MLEEKNRADGNNILLALLLCSVNRLFAYKR